MKFEPSVIKNLSYPDFMIFKKVFYINRELEFQILKQNFSWLAKKAAS
jgi:hypothetical protein